ncbi:hypothetical protein ACF1BE_11740 [Streptomyces sp. NPDC014991]
MRLPDGGAVNPVARRRTGATLVRLAPYCQATLVRLAPYGQARHYLVGP